MSTPSIACGIDFGTSNSTCAITDNNNARLITLEGESSTLPSALFFAYDGSILFGRAAINAYIEGEDGRLMRGLKSILGTALMQEKTIIQGRSCDFTEILKIYIQHLKSKAESDLNQKIHTVIMGRPVHFHDDDPNADLQSENILRDIAQKVGFEEIHFQYEPIAAAFAHEQHLTGDQLAFVVDLGGGTSDFSVIRLSPDKSTQRDRKSDILATTGTRIGGTNFDKRLSLKHFMPHLGLGTQYRSEFDSTKILDIPSKPYMELAEWSLVHFAQTSKAIRESKDILKNALDPQKIQRLLKVQSEGLGHACLQAVERTKIDLTNKHIANIDVQDLGLDMNIPVSKPDFEIAIADQIHKITTCLEDCLAQSGHSADEIDLIILTGGSSELPIINDYIATYFPNATISKDNKFGSVGLGLAHHARRYLKNTV